MEMVGNLYRVNQTAESLERLFTDTIMEIMRVQWIGFFACGEQQGEFTLECTKPIVKEWKEVSVSLTQEQVGRVEKEQTAVVLPASDNSTYCSVSQVISSRLGDQKISLMLPLFDAGTTLKEHRKGSRLKGFVLLGERELKQPYSSVELHYLKLAAKQFRQAVQNLNLIEKRKQERLEREYRSLEQLSGSPQTTVTAQTLGLRPLRESAPDILKEMVERYSKLMDRALDERTHKTDHETSDGLRAIVEQLGFFRASPREVVEIHTIAMKRKTAEATPETLCANNGETLFIF